MHLKLIYVYTIFIFNSTQETFASSLLDWLDWTQPESKQMSNKPAVSLPSIHENVNVREGVTLISVPFEELSPEDQFLQEAQRISSISLSGLDTCEHKVVMKIQNTCSDLTEEELAKLSIQLLNCQSEVSGRKQVTCSDEMSLKECTAPMDGELWNAYHIINNRARAVCYATRQQQFRVLSEMTVNKLMTSSLKQLTTMDNLEEVQKKVNVLTADTLGSLKEGQLELMDQTSGLKLAQTRVRDNIAGNLKQLTREKTLIQSTHDQLRTLSEKLAQQLEGVGTKLESQSEQHQHIHREILSSLADIAANTHALWTIIEEKSEEMQQQQNQMKESSSDTLDKLRQINVSVSYLLHLVGQVQAAVDQNIHWATGAIGGDEDILMSVVQHTLFLLAGVLVSLFLQLSLACRILLLATVLSNVVLVYRRQPLTFLTLSAVVICVWATAVLIPPGWAAFNKYRTRSKQNSEQPRKNVEEETNEEDEEDRLSSRSTLRSESVLLNNNIAHRPLLDDIDEGPFKDSDSLSSLRFRRSTSRDSRSCAAVCRNGQLCRSTPTPGHQFCRRHISH